MHKILVIRLYFSLNTLRVSDCISPSSGAYTKYDVQLLKVAPDDGLMQSETRRVFNEK